MSRRRDSDRKGRDAKEDARVPDMAESAVEPETADSDTRAPGPDRDETGNATGKSAGNGTGKDTVPAHRRPITADAPDAEAGAGANVGAGGRPASLGEMLSEARQRKGLELSDISELTHIRQEYLRALEDGRYQDLPEDVYSRNYVRLYAQAVGLEAETVVDTYARERRRTVGMSTLEERLEKERRGEVPEADRRAGLPFGTLLPTLALLVVLAGLAVWGFNSLLLRPNRGPDGASTVSTGTPAVGGGAASGGAPLTGKSGSGGASSAGAATAGVAAGGTTSSVASNKTTNAPAGVVGDAVEARTVHVSVVTDPPGASVSIDGFALPGTTPIHDVPVTAREGRVVNVTLTGYQPLQQTVDLRQDRDLSYQLTPLPGAQPAAPAASDQAVTPASVSARQIGVNITARTWLEVYRSTARNQGERLVYATVDAGKHYVFDLPVYLHVGNAAGVDIVTSAKDLGPMGSPGAVVSRAFPAP